MAIMSSRLDPYRALAGAAAIAAIVPSLIAVPQIESAQATTIPDPYSVPQVIDTNANPDIVETTLVADEATLDVGLDRMARGMAFNGTVPGPEFRLKVNDTVIVHFENHLCCEPTGIHWHGIELNNASDGSPLTQNQVPPGGTFLYQFKVPREGIYWYHPHHHSSTNQVFKGLYGSIIITDPNEAALVTSGALPPPEQTRTLALSDVTVCKRPATSFTPSLNDDRTYDPSLPWVGGCCLPEQPAPWPKELCETPIDDHGEPIVDGNMRPIPLRAGDIPNIQKKVDEQGRVNEGQTVLTNGVNVGGRAGSPEAPGALADGAYTVDVKPGEGLRLQIGNAAAVRYFRLRLTDCCGTQIPLVRVGGEAGLLDNAIVEGGMPGGFDTEYSSGEILLAPGDRADVVAAIPPDATGVATLWTQDYQRTGQGDGWTNIPTVPVAHLNITNDAPGSYTIADGACLRSCLDPVDALGAATDQLLDPNAFVPVRPGTANQEIQLTNAGPGGPLGINGVQGAHEVPEPYNTAPHFDSSRYARLHETLELTVKNMTGAHHPFHLHGFSIQPRLFTKTGGPNFTFAYNEFMDNIDVPAGYTLTFRVKLDDRPMMDGTTPGGGVGRWMFHCHIFFHAVFGMISELVVVENQRPIANDDAVQTRAGVNVTINVLSNDSDPDCCDTLTVLAVSDPPNGTATINPNNTVTYDPDGCFVGIDTFTYTITDGNAGTAMAMVTVRVRKASGCSG
jgi:FtsP/CotA-like multicopper oxidase with cupredoxin domain